jgi:hypothetical protein
MTYWHETATSSSGVQSIARLWQVRPGVRVGDLALREPLHLGHRGALRRRGDREGLGLGHGRDDRDRPGVDDGHRGEPRGLAEAEGVVA